MRLCNSKPLVNGTTTPTQNPFEEVIIVEGDAMDLLGKELNISSNMKKLSGAARKYINLLMLVY